MGNETCTMACTLHIQYCNGFHDLQNGHVDLEQWLCRLDPRKPISNVLLRGLKRVKKGT